MMMASVIHDLTGGGVGDGGVWWWQQPFVECIVVMATTNNQQHRQETRQGCARPDLTSLFYYPGWIRQPNETTNQLLESVLEYVLY
jgi:hypothetical protein